MVKTIKKLLLFSGDLLFLHLALLITLYIRYPYGNHLFDFLHHWPDFSIVFVIWLVVFYALDLYNLNFQTFDRKFIRLTLNAVLISSIFSVIFFYIVDQPTITPKTNLAIFIGIYTVLFILWRLSYKSYIVKVIPQINLAIIGKDKNAKTLIDELSKNPAGVYRLAMILQDTNNIDSLTENVQAKNIQVIVVCDDFGESERMENALFRCLSFKVDFINYPDFYELLTGKIPVEAIGQNWFLENLKAGQKNYYNAIKRGIDCVLAVLIFIGTSPLWILIGIAIKTTSKGPVFFRQVRFGKNEKEYKIIKFRTMRIDNNDGSPTEKNDLRITKLGTFLRRTRLDEIPQVLNVLSGDMSFIGPRPERPELIVELERHIPFYKTRLLIKPGLTGWDQISGSYHSPSLIDTMEKLQHDLFYLKHRSLSFDLSIALKTIATMLFHEGR